MCIFASCETLISTFKLALVQAILPHESQNKRKFCLRGTLAISGKHGIKIYEMSELKKKVSFSHFRIRCNRYLEDYLPTVNSYFRYWLREGGLDLEMWAPSGGSPRWDTGWTLRVRAIRCEPNHLLAYSTAFTSLLSFPSWLVFVMLQKLLMCANN